MAKTAFTTSDALTKKAWEEKFFRDVLKETYFRKFTGASSTNIVQENTVFTKQKGDNVTFGLKMRYTGAGVTSGQALEGNEEKMVTHSMSVTLEEYAHAVRDNGPLDRQRVLFSIDEESVQGLKDWGSEKIDSLIFDVLTGTGTDTTAPTKIFYGGTATSTTNITASDLITPALISKVRAYAKTGGNRTYIPLRPVRVDGKEYFVMVVHPYVIYDLSQDAQWSQAAREALPRGTDNPIFSGADYLWDGVVIHSHENVPTVTTWGAGGNVPGAKCIFMGAQAAVFAWGQRQEVVSETFDYEREHGFGWSIIAKAGKSKFNSLDFGSLAVYVAMTNIT